MAKVKFRTNVQLKSIIGKDLITDDNIAVLELVKNSFDAGATKAEITFKNIIRQNKLVAYRKSNNSILIIKDDGSGMSETDLKDKWLNIAYSDKKDKQEEYNRQLAGNKGVGRFSCDRLGKQLVIYTKKKGKDLIKLSIDWRKFENINDISKNIQDITFETEVITNSAYKKETKLASLISGTVLYISNLREEWTHSKILSLKKQLEKFINPNQNFEAKKFDVSIQANDYKLLEKKYEQHNKINGVVKNQIFDKLNFRVTYIHSTISKDGSTILTKLNDRGHNIFTLSERNPYHLLKNIEIYIYYLNPYSKAYFKRQTGVRSVDFGSISLFINGFRIPPYGDAGNDWLGMEQRKGQKRTSYLGTREVIGRIEINGVDFDENKDDFFIISNRSGVDNNEHYKQLTKNKTPFGFYYKTFRRLERFVVEGINWDSTIEKNYSAIEDKVLNDKTWNKTKERYVEDSLTRNKRILAVVEKIIDSKKSEKISLEVNEKFITELSKEQSKKSQNEIDKIASSIKKKGLTSHELESFVQQITTSENELNDFPKSKKEISSILKQQEKLKQRLLKQLEQTKKLEKDNQEKEAEAERLQKELELEKEKNTYLRTSSRNLTEDAKGLVHNIKITSKKISDSVDNLYYKILNDKYNKKMLLKTLGAIKFQSEKATKISKIITRSNFKTDKNAHIADIVIYIKQYIDIYSDIYPKNELKFIINEDNSSLVRKFNLLDMAVVLDDLISNSVKAEASKIQLNISNLESGELKILFSDNGKGVDKAFTKTEVQKEKIFELGITTTDGSGIGLSSVRNGLKLLNGSIKLLGNRILLKGACFEIIIK